MWFLLILLLALWCRDRHYLSFIDEKWRRSIKTTFPKSHCLWVTMEMWTGLVGLGHSCSFPWLAWGDSAGLLERVITLSLSNLKASPLERLEKKAGGRRIVLWLECESVYFLEHRGKEKCRQRGCSTAGILRLTRLSIFITAAGSCECGISVISFKYLKG